MAKKTLLVKLVLSEILYNIDSVTHITGRSRFDGKNDAQVAYIQTNDEDEVLDQLYRIVGNSFSRLKMKLSEYLNEKETAANNVILGGANIVDASKTCLAISLKVPSNFNFSVRDSVAASMHQYIVDSAIADWFKMTNKTDAKDYYELAEKDIIDLREAINKRMRPTRTSVAAPEIEHMTCCYPLSTEDVDKVFEDEEVVATAVINTESESALLNKRYGVAVLRDGTVSVLSKEGKTCNPEKGSTSDMVVYSVFLIDGVQLSNIQLNSEDADNIAAVLYGKNQNDKTKVKINAYPLQWQDSYSAKWSSKMFGTDITSSQLRDFFKI